jgi:hypothetical protein
LRLCCNSSSPPVSAKKSARFGLLHATRSSPSMFRHGKEYLDVPWACNDNTVQDLCLVCIPVLAPQPSPKPPGTLAVNLLVAPDRMLEAFTEVLRSPSRPTTKGFPTGLVELVIILRITHGCYLASNCPTTRIVAISPPPWYELLTVNPFQCKALRIFSTFHLIGLFSDGPCE